MIKKTTVESNGHFGDRGKYCGYSCKEVIIMERCMEAALGKMKPGSFFYFGGMQQSYFLKLFIVTYKYYTYVRT